MPPNDWKSQFAPDLVASYERALAQNAASPDVCGVDIGYLSDGLTRPRNVGIRLHLREMAPAPSGVALSLEAPAPMGIAMAGAAPDRTGLAIIKARYALHPAPPGATAADGTRRAYSNPLQPGVLIAHALRTGGTLGLLVRDGMGRVLLLGSDHVVGRPSPGDTPDVVQPTTPMTVGEVVHGFDDADGDAALVLPNGSRAFRPAQFESHAVVRNAAMPWLGLLVEKSGIGTNVTRGRVDGMGTYFVGGGGNLPMEGFRIVADSESVDLSGPGDSGAAWYGADDAVGYGLHVGGDVTVRNPLTQPAIACFLTRVLDRLGVSPLA